MRRREHAPPACSGVRRRNVDCKIYDEFSKTPGDRVEFWYERGETPSDVARKISHLFEGVKSSEGDTFDRKEQINLDDKSVSYVVRTLQKYELSGSGRDVLGEAFETILGTALRGGEGQFFTPRNLARLAVEIVNPKLSEAIIDPACGAGGFLIESLRHASKFNGKDNQTSNFEGKLIGIDKDRFLAKIANAQLKIYGSDSKTFCENSLLNPEDWAEETKKKISLGSFDVVITNPPFGSKIPVEGEQILSQYQLAKEWKSKKVGDKIDYVITRNLKPSEAPQILFIERCLELLKEGGRMAIVLPEGILGNSNTGFIRKFIKDRAEIIAVIDCPLETFMPSTPTKTCLLVLRKAREIRQKNVFMAIAEKCGHDRRGVPVLRENGSPDDDFPEIAEKFDEFRSQNNVPF
jgi:type I restriction enzyme M protein